MNNFLIVLIAFVMQSTLQAQAQATVSSDSIYASVDVEPEFPGGMKALGKYVDGRKNHKYPEEARRNNVEGKVFVKFLINKDGSCSNFEVVKGIGFGCDEAAVEAFKKMPKWKPALVNEKPVTVERQMGYLYKL
jgi:periplasmic protein TonB